MLEDKEPRTDATDTVATVRCRGAGRDRNGVFRSIEMFADVDFTVE
jgi:hypothetical protein